jgi:hypothetical protein
MIWRAPAEIKADGPNSPPLDRIETEIEKAYIAPITLLDISCCSSNVWRLLADGKSAHIPSSLSWNPSSQTVHILLPEARFVES